MAAARTQAGVQNASQWFSIETLDSFGLLENGISDVNRRWHGEP